jgi:hypothetical protein
MTDSVSRDISLPQPGDFVVEHTSESNDTNQQSFVELENEEL